MCIWKKKQNFKILSHEYKLILKFPFPWTLKHPPTWVHYFVLKTAVLPRLHPQRRLPLLHPLHSLLDISSKLSSSAAHPFLTKTATPKSMNLDGKHPHFCSPSMWVSLSCLSVQHHFWTLELTSRDNNLILPNKWPLPTRWPPAQLGAWPHMLLTVPLIFPHCMTWKTFSFP